MQILQLPEPMLTYGLAADTFPEGIQQAHERLHRLLPAHKQRNYFGLSWPYDGQIIYLAATTAVAGENLATGGLQVKEITAGAYLYIDVPFYNQHPEQIGMAIRKLIADERIDPAGFCIEWYLDGGLCRCMVRMQETTAHI